MKPKMKKIHSYLKTLLSLTLILALMATNLLTASMTVYANETTVTEQATSTQTTGTTQTSTDEAGTDTTSTDGTSTETTSTDGTSTDTTSTDTTSTDSTSTDSTSTDSTSTDSTSTDGTSTDKTSTDGTSTDSTSTDTTSTDGTSIGTTSTDGTSTDGTNTDSTGTDVTTTDASKTEETTTTETADEAQTKTTEVKAETTGEKALATGKQYNFGTTGDITKTTLFDDTVGYGFSDIEYPNEAKGWDSNVYYPREALITQSLASFVEDSSDYLAISSKTWTETESTGYGVYTYENTSTLDFNLEPANYNVKVTLTNPTSSEITAYLEAEDITKVSDIKIAAGEQKEVEFTACLIDDVLNLKFLSPSTATSEADASNKTVYVKSVSFEAVTNQAGSKPTIYIASDSTVQTYESSYYPQTGWGQLLYNFFGDFVEERECEDANYSQSQTYETSNVIIENRAIGGRSSKSFVEEGKLDDLLEDIKPGDYLLVQWGHNDATYSRPNRYVSSSDFEKWMQYYVDGAKQRGATCVLVTPVARYSYSTTADGALDSFASNFEAYRNVMQKMSSEQSVPIVDLTGLSIELCNSFGIEGAKSLFLMLAAGDYEGYYAGGVTDTTHLQYYGAYKFAQCVAKGIKGNESEQLSGLASTVSISIPDNAPAVPANLKKTTVGASSISMTWDAADGAELYYIYRQELADGQTADTVDFSTATKYSVSSKTSYTDSGCEGGKIYVYAIAGFNEKGVGTLSDKITVSTKSAAYKFDFGSSTSSNVMTGWTEVTEKTLYAAETGYGFKTAPGAARNRSNNGNAASSAMADDFCLGASEFALDVPNGDYEVTIYACDLLSGTSTIKPTYTGEGVAIGGISTKQALGSMTATVRVLDGQLNIGVGGTNAYINGMEVTPILGTPTQLSYSEMSFTTTQASFLINFTGIEEAAYYNVYQKSSTDKTFTVIKTIQAAEINELSSRSMVAALGEKYQYYVTAVTSEQKESAASNTIEIEMIDKSVAVPVAPQNVKCDSAENAKITISWDESSDALSYIIYRSDKAESDKGFKEYTKVGTSTSATFTDTYSDLTTNIHYYYKVQGKNAGGVGELSDVCITPISGELIAATPEKLVDRGVVAVDLAGDAGAATSMSATDADGNEYTSGVYVSWRSFEGDFDGSNNLTTTFTVYRNNTEIASNITVTNLVDEGGKAGDTYKVVGSNDGSLGLTAKDTTVWNNQYLELQLFKPADETMPDASVCNYTANDMSVGDIDGDGDYELFVKWYPSNAKDNSGYGYTGKCFIDVYDIDMQTGGAVLLYRVDLGVNIRSGAHYSPFQVWDFDGDGKAELALKTADGTTTYKSNDGTDQGLVEIGHVGACNSEALPTDTISTTNDYRNSNGFVLDGPEYFTMFDDDGEIIDTVDYTPERGTVSAWGDAYGNRVDRFLSAVAYLNGQTPCAVFARGYYTRTCLTAYTLVDTNNDGIGDKLDTYWKFDTNNLLDEYDVELIEAQGNHNLSINDIDNDGKDEIIYGSLVVDHDGTMKYSTGLGHGDALHVSDWVSWNDGLEIMQVHEHEGIKYHVEVHDAETGEILMGFYTGKDTGRGVMSDIDPTYPYAEFWSIASPSYVSTDEPAWNSKNGGMYSSSSTLSNLVTIASDSPASNGTIFWDGDLLSEIFDHTFNTTAYVPLTTTIAKWNYETSKEELLVETDEAYTSNGTKGNPGLIADLLGDWREEMVLRASDNTKVRIYTTTIQTDYVVPCLMDNLAYREGVAWENVGYNQPAHLSYLLSESLITSQVSVAETTKNSVKLNFTPANDGTYGHEIQGYEVYRTVANADNYTLIATVKNDSLTVKTGTSGADTVYEYTDTTAKGGTSYLYKVAAIVDDKTSFMSRTASANTLVDIKSVKDIVLDSIVEDTVLQDGQTVADLLPKTVTVVDSNSNEVAADVTWDVSKVDLTTAGTYAVIATVAGYDNTIETTLIILENKITGYTAIADIKAVIGTTITLPQTVEVKYLNGTTSTVNVSSWNGTLDNTKLGTYALTAVTEVSSEIEIRVNVIVVDDYIASLTGTLDPIEVVVNSTITSNMLPATVNAKYASGNTGAAAITWSTDGIDTSAEGVITITGSVVGYDSNISMSARVVKYPALYKFDFGIKGSTVANGWTGISVNPKGGTATAESLGIVYSSEKGFGFDCTAATVINGRAEAFNYTDAKYPMPGGVYGDFGLLQGNTFSAAVANGKYSVEIMSNSSLKGDAKGTIEGTSFSFTSAANTYVMGTYETEVTDGKLSIAFTGTNARIGAIIIRSLNETTPTDPIVEKYTATFNSNGGSEVTSQTIESQSLISQPVDPLKDGYTFDGWYKDSSLTTMWNFATDTVTEDITLYAKWNVVTYSVIFNSNGGSEVATQTVEFGKVASQPATPAKSGYTFAGWYKETSLNTSWNFTGDMITENVILYAKWDAIKVNSIKLDEESMIVGIDTHVVLKATISPTDAADTGVLWSSSNSDVASVDQSGVVTANKMGVAIITATAADGSNITASCNITVGYKITYVLNGGTNNVDNPTGYVAKTKVKLLAPTKSGYTFEGWYTEDKFKKKIDEINKGTKKNVTVYAKWEKITVDKATIDSLKNSGNGKMKVKLDKVSGAKGYEIVYSTESNFIAGVETILITSKSKTIKNLTKGSTYYVKARAYKVDDSGNKIYGNYSSVEKVTIKK